uniref:Uncharacterized protein n=1 Tax=Anguilla anguilla TaxID=7936 RepID=A0A0E9R3Z5_ANGAN
MKNRLSNTTIKFNETTQDHTRQICAFPFILKSHVSNFDFFL